MINDKLVRMHTALLAKKLKFDWPCNHLYDEYGDIDDLNYYEGDGSGWCTNSGIESKEDYVIELAECTAPTQTSLQRWLRDKHGVHVSSDIEETFMWVWRIQSLHSEASYTGFTLHSPFVYSTYEEALEEGLEEILKILNRK